MPRPVQVEDIRALLAGALDSGANTKRRRGAKPKRKSIAVAGNIVNLKIPTACVKGLDQNRQDQLTIRVMYTVLAGCGIAAACILGSVYLLRDFLS